ncbi:DUF3087 family protein [Psychrosphaera sp. 1_MG-2023]|uniref:DUF3087 family protein n=1 Tax=Psychrosphaera sp. 1_MG-2023 TaxID=3062643 RepID=UPI0026E396C7|nr:DUF3087 family protein [Psychrosphaera sp. 1_MG-2023]MDO6719603.1 DUF3087 family protein [Psychrosphaera sp. 1_MG-2023]
MKLLTIDKQTYRKHLNVVIAICVVSLAVLSLLISQSAIYFFTDREGSHFWLNVMGVAVAMMLIGTALKKVNQHAYMREVYYVWKLKQQINYIYRKSRKIDAAVAENNVDAITVMNFYYKACEQLYTLDDNTITINSLTKKSNELQDKIESLNLKVSVEDYQQSLLDKF